MLTEERNGSGTTGEGRNRSFPGALTFYHPNGKGTGAAARLELRLNGPGEERYDCFFLELAKQKTVANRRSGEGFATFDWENKVTVKLGFLDVCALLAVLEGGRDQVGENGNGLYHQTNDISTLIAFRRAPERPGYFLAVSRKQNGGAQLFKGHILLTDAEGLGLRCVFQTGLFFMAYHSSLRTV